MIKINNTTEVFRRVSKADIIQFFKSIMNDKNVANGLVDGSITLLSANYKRDRKRKSIFTESFPEVSKIELNVKFTLIVPKIGQFKESRDYFELMIVRDKKTKSLTSISISKFETLKNKKS